MDDIPLTSDAEPLRRMIDAAAVREPRSAVAGRRDRREPRCSVPRMTRAEALLAALTDEYASTEALYERVGYPTLVRVGLVQYAAFRAELVWLQADKQAQSITGEDGSTLWRRAAG
jgi:hypothetical protein